MRSLSFAAIAICVLSVSSCIVEPHGDFHRGWWDEHHRGGKIRIRWLERHCDCSRLHKNRTPLADAEYACQNFSWVIGLDQSRVSAAIIKSARSAGLFPPPAPESTLHS